MICEPLCSRAVFDLSSLSCLGSVHILYVDSPLTDCVDVSCSVIPTECVGCDSVCADSSA